MKEMSKGDVKKANHSLDSLEEINKRLEEINQKQIKQSEQYLNSINLKTDNSEGKENISEVGADINKVKESNIVEYEEQEEILEPEIEIYATQEEFEGREKELDSRDYRVNERTLERPDLSGLIPPEKLIQFIPYKFIAGGVVFTTVLVSDKSNGNRNSMNSLYRLEIKTNSKIELNGELKEILKMEESFIFYGKDTAVVIMDLLEVLDDLNAKVINKLQYDQMNNNVIRTYNSINRYARSRNPKDLIPINEGLEGGPNIGAKSGSKLMLNEK